MVSLKISDLRKTFFTPTKLSHPKSRSINKKALAGISIELILVFMVSSALMVRENPP